MIKLPHKKNREPEAAGFYIRYTIILFNRINQCFKTCWFIHSKISKHFTVDIDSKADPIVITIKDDGIGFDPKSLSNVHSLGIVGMKERSNLIGAEFSMYNRRSGGVGIELKIPRSLQLSHKQKEANSIEK